MRWKTWAVLLAVLTVVGFNAASEFKLRSDRNRATALKDRVPSGYVARWYLHVDSGPMGNMCLHVPTVVVTSPATDTERATIVEFENARYALSQDAITLHRFCSVIAALTFGFGVFNTITQFSPAKKS